jgi:hypothetical protein
MQFAKRVWMYVDYSYTHGFVERAMIEGEETGAFLAYAQLFNQPFYRIGQYAHLRSAKRAVERECR